MILLSLNISLYVLNCVVILFECCDEVVSFVVVLNDKDFIVRYGNDFYMFVRN